MNKRTLQTKNLMSFNNNDYLKTHEVINRKVLNLRFQNCVILDSNKTDVLDLSVNEMFQNCVILDSNKTSRCEKHNKEVFQNCVILDSNKTTF